MDVLTYRGYQAKVRYSKEDQVLVGEVLGVADSLSFYAEKASEAEDMFRQCIDNYLDFCREVGKEPDKVYSGSFNVRLGPELHKAAELAAAERDVTLNQFVAAAVDHEVKGPPERVIYYVVKEPERTATFRTGDGAESADFVPVTQRAAKKRRSSTWTQLMS